MSSPARVAAAAALVMALVSATLTAAAVAGAASGAATATGPPRGWNSYDSFTWIVNETAFVDNAKAQASLLKPYGYEFTVVDYLWYQAQTESGALKLTAEDEPHYHPMRIDANGRLLPDLQRWPSATGGSGFTAVAAQVHALGLKFGIHTMRGISQTAYAADSPILGTPYTAKDIALPDKRCPWDADFMSVNVSHPGGRAFYDSVRTLLAGLLNCAWPPAPRPHTTVYPGKGAGLP